MRSVLKYMKKHLFILSFFLILTASCEKEKTPPLKPEALTYLALGDSYTIGQSVEIEQRFPEQLVDSLATLGLKIEALKIVARTGWTTGELNTGIDAAKIQDSTYGLVSLLIGVNNQYRGRSVAEYIPEFQALLNRAVAFAGGKKERVFVVSIPDWGQTPFGNGFDPVGVGRQIDIFNAASDSVTRAQGIRYFNITPISRQWASDAALVAADNLHPSGKQYGLWVRLMKNGVAQMLK
jgi:lysophospholipase L1-like esterase